jgi:protein-L-isoaspartate(D-aspartate) O-methyltransferase
VQRHERVLEIGAGSGYMAALLSHKAQSVISLDIVPELARLASANLQRAGAANVSVREADGSQGLASEAPFDVIMLSGSVASVPQALLQQLKVGGRLIGTVGSEPVMRAVRITRLAEARFTEADLFDTVLPRLQGFGEPTRFAF